MGRPNKPNNLVQGSKLWFETRENHITSTDIAVINGTNPWKSQYTLWLEKTGRKKPDKPNEAMEHGKQTEPAARSLYNNETGREVSADVSYSKEWDRGMASLDGVSKNGSVLYEAKCPTNPKLYYDALEKILPDYYFDQIQWHLFNCREALFCDYHVYITDDESTVFHVYAIDDHQQMLLEKAKVFWKYIEDDTPPPRKEGEPEYVDSRLSNELAKEWLKWKEKEKEAVEKRKEIETDLKELHDNQKCFFTDAKVKMNPIERKGSIDWVKITKDYSISEEKLEKYRKNPVAYISFTS